MQTHYCHSSSLGAKIKIETLSIKHYSGKKAIANEAGEKTWNPITAANLGKADLMVYLAYDKDEKGPSGIASGGIVCTTGSGNIKHKQSISEWQKTVPLFAWVTSLQPKKFESTF